MPRPAPRWLLAFDVDDTLLGDDAALRALAAALLAHRPRLCLTYNSSRPCASLRQSLRAHPGLPEPDYLIGALGTEIEAGATGEPLGGYDSRWEGAWQREPIDALMRSLGLQPHAPEYQTRFKASYDVPDPDGVERARERLERAGWPVTMIFSGGKNLDVIPRGAGKGAAVDHMRRALGLEAGRVVVAGDSGNDLDMFRPEYKGIVVANAEPALHAMTADHIYHAQAARAAGVLEGLRHWGVLAAENSN